MRSFLALVAIVVLGIGGCAGPPAAPPDPAAYTGTWSRTSEAGPSTLAILVEGSTVWFRWSLGTADAARSVRCEWRGTCEERHGTDKVGEYRFRPWIDPHSRRLMVEVWQDVTSPEPVQEHWIDELLLHASGDRLVARTVERNGMLFDGTTRPSYEFQRVASTVEDPPRDLAQGTGAEF